MTRTTWFWAGLAIIVAGVGCLMIFISSVTASATNADGSVTPGLNWDALTTSAGRALPTMLFWIVCFLLLDRYRPQRPLVWFLALFWGGAIAVTGAYYLNSWVGLHMAVVDESSGTSAIRVAVFVAPFIEEFMKGSAVFLIVLLDRNRFTSRVSGAVIGGLAGAGFAFSENIIYYARVIVYGSYTSGAGDVQDYLNYMVVMRGVLTSFGHPLFTLFTGVGVAFGVTSRSKTVRVLAPVSGYLLAAFSHMLFNWITSVTSNDNLVPLLMIMAWPVVIAVALRLVVSAVRQGRLVSNRLGDYCAMGWLPPAYPAAMSRVRTRAWTLAMSLWHARVAKTWKLQHRATQLAFLREAIARGTIDDAGLWRERDLIDEMADLARSGALVDGRGLRPYWPWKAWSRRIRRQFRGEPIVNAPLKVVSSPLKYSATDPRWGPPPA